MEKETSEAVTLEGALKLSVETLAQLALRQQALIEQLTAPKDTLTPLLQSLAPFAPMIIELVKDLRPQRMPPIGFAERRARAEAAAKQADVEREMFESIERARAADEAASAAGANGVHPCAADEGAASTPANGVAAGAH
jgi:hypothetical protein